MSAFEIEIKSLLGTVERAEELKMKLREIEPRLARSSQNKQRNHYFVHGDVGQLFAVIKPHLTKSDAEKLHEVFTDGTDFSIRSRLVDDKKLLFVVKASRDGGTSDNAISRLEFEAEIPDMTLSALDQLLLDSGFAYQAKWSREREEYQCNDITVCFDKNAGYGYLAEFEKVVRDESRVSDVKRELQSFMNRLGVEELPQDRLERMFAHYNAHWPEYYGTDRIFVVE
jgi:predicted adenylyl cyclase CyaB